MKKSLMINIDKRIECAPFAKAHCTPLHAFGTVAD